MSITVRSLVGAEMLSVLDEFARLRVQVFRDFPYLYDGDAAYEAQYLAGYGAHPHTIMVGAWDGTALVGAATAMPLTAHDDAARLSLPNGAPPARDVFYCAESVLLPDYRGQGIGHAFFDHREASARDNGYGWSAFASVIRPATHPLRPADYRPLEGFWRARGYAPLEGAVMDIAWTDIGETEQSTKELQVWLRPL